MIIYRKINTCFKIGKKEDQSHHFDKPVKCIGVLIIHGLALHHRIDLNQCVHFDIEQNLDIFGISSKEKVIVINQKPNKIHQKATSDIFRHNHLHVHHQNFIRIESDPIPHQQKIENEDQQTYRIDNRKSILYLWICAGGGDLGDHDDDWNLYEIVKYGKQVQNIPKKKQIGLRLYDR